MNEYWIIYNLTTGEELYRGSGAPGNAQLQELPEDHGIIVVPSEVMKTRPLNLEPIRAGLLSRIDSQAEAVRGNFITLGAGQAITYMIKEQEARAYLLDDTTEAPVLMAEAAAIGVTVAALATEVMTIAGQWRQACAVIEAARRKAKLDVEAATNLAELVAAANIDWQALLTA